ncbi:MAG: M67 family metallopeptidase [Anaerolineae bacterium]
MHTGLPGPPGRLILQQPTYEQMLALVQAAYPLEACGLLAGQGERAAQLYPIDNILRSPTAFEMDPLQQVEAMLQIEAQGLELLAIYHSHPHGPQKPSASDVARAFYPETVQLIISLQERRRPVTRAFTIVDGHVREVPFLIEQL